MYYKVDQSKHVIIFFS